MSTDVEIEERLREFCMLLPESVEVDLMGNTAFRVATKTFVVFEHLDGRPVLVVKLPPEEQAALVAQPGFDVAPDTGEYGWTCISVDAAPDWDEVDRLVMSSYRGQAPDHLQRQLDQMLSGG